MIRIDPRSLDVIAEIRRRMIAMVPELTREVTEETAQKAFEEARAAADRHTKTGALVRSLKLRRLSDKKLEVYHDLQIAPHALFVHWGTRAHEIRPKQNRPNPHLRFVGSNGGFVFVKRVWHPGYKGDPYLVRARTAVAQQFMRMARDIWKRLFNRNYSGQQGT
ncbi:MAG: hypothetical protein ACUVR3_11320 [Candidatus Roseilinea sp.]|uniref:hypothetical protein n=1 Tax=Candidatus Roseilinea sp. TaxID=2838777 RepID=UPI00404AA16A